MYIVSDVSLKFVHRLRASPHYTMYYSTHTFDDLYHFCMHYFSMQ